MDHYRQLASQPLKLCSNRVWRTYMGGQLLEEWQEKPDASDSEFPEEWIASVVKAKNAGREQIEEGFSCVLLGDGCTVTLKELLEFDPNLFLGQAHTDQYGVNLGVLVKALDSSERLTIQVHPDPGFAQEYFHSRFGKTEAWYVIKGRTLNGVEPQLYLGFKPGMTRDKWRQLFETQDIQGMMDALHSIPLHEGDVYLVEGGIPHAIGSGCFLIEIQEPTDLTLRTERTTPRGIPVPDAACHQGIGFDRVLDCFHYDAYAYEEMLHRWKIAPMPAREEEGGQELQLIGRNNTKCFQMSRVTVNTSFNTFNKNTFAIAVVIAGEGTVNWGGNSLRVKKSDQLFMPYSCPDLIWNNSGTDPLQFLLCYPPSAQQ